MPDLSIEQIIQQLDIKAFFSTLGITFLKRAGGGGYYCLCPFCQDEAGGSATSSSSGKKKDGKLWLAVEGEKEGGWRCHKCGESGNATQLYVKLRGGSTGEAVRAMKEFAGIREEVREVKPKDSNTPPWEDSGSSVPDPSAPKQDTSKQDTPAALPGEIFTRFIALCPLTPEHSRELQIKRGFTPETVQALRYRSGGEHVPVILETLREEFADADMLKAGLLLSVNGSMVYNQQLCDSRIIIPYIAPDGAADEESGQVYHLRPHKLGLPNKPPHVYCSYFLMDKPEKIILTEGEFKAAALWQEGVPAIAVPGVSSFGGKYFERLVDLLQEYGARQVVVVYDNEDKSDPSLPTYKKKPEDRYDTQFWAYIMAYKLSEYKKASFSTRIGWLPDEWREGGKADWDSALAAGKRRADFLAVIEAAVGHKEFLDSLPEEARRIIQRKISRHFARVPVDREFNKYVATRTSGRGENRETWKEVISNFVINIKSSFFTSDGVVRNVQLLNEYGEASEIFSLVPSDMAGLNEWKKFCFSKGNYVFEGDTKDLLNVWKREFLRDTGDLVYVPDRIGLIDDKKNLWLFGNMAVDAQAGKVYPVDNDRICWVDGRGYRPQSLQINARGEAVDDVIPSLDDNPQHSLDIKEIALKLRQSVGGYEAYIGIGWAVAAVFSKDIFAAYKCFPILFPHGKRESGKSTFMRWLMCFFGVETEGVGIAETTQNYIARSLSYYSSLGAWFDEYRNEIRVTQKDGFFRSAYNRQFSGKGTTTAFQTRGFAVHSVLAVSGEELPKDNGLFTRLVPLQISAYKRDREHYDWFNAHCTWFSGFTYKLLLNYEKLKPKILKNIAELRAALMSKGVTDRTAENWAICAAAFESVVFEDDEFIGWVERTCQEIKQSGEEEHMLNVFWNDVGYLVSEGKIGRKQIAVEGNGAEREMFVWLSGCYEAWALHYKQKTGREPFDEQSLRKYLQDEPYYLRQDRIYLGVGSNVVQRRCCVIGLDMEDTPETLLEIAANLEVS